HEWIEIQVGQEGESFWVGGLYSPNGAKRLRYDHVHIALCPTRDEATKLGRSIADQATSTRLLLGLSWGCAFTSVL
ncbi:MAG TPA: hypothetical protein VLZ55_06865, partial [Rhodanobacter sp.]|nr:hypothetical protein [Rhodanobacter sp.]